MGTVLQNIVEKKHYKFIDGEGVTWQETIWLSTLSLVADGTVTEDFYKQIIACVEKYGPYIVFEHNIAMPHTQENADGALKTGVGFMVSKKLIDFTGVPGAVLIESGLSCEEVGLDFVVAESSAVGIKVTLVDNFLECGNSARDVGIVPCSLACEDLVQGFVADRLDDDGLEVLGHAPCLFTGAAERNDAFSKQVVTALGQVFIGLRNVVPAGTAEGRPAGDHVHVRAGVV